MENCGQWTPPSTMEKLPKLKSLILPILFIQGLPSLCCQRNTTTMAAQSYSMSAIALVIIFFATFTVGSATVLDWTCNRTALGRSDAHRNNLKSLLHDLVDGSHDFAAARSGNGTAEVFGLFQCLAGVSPYDCNICGQEARYFLRQTCPRAAGATLWSNWCFLRFEGYDFVARAEKRAKKASCRESNADGKFSRGVVRSLMEELSATAPREERLFATKSVGGSYLDAEVEIKGHAQCWRDLSQQDCATCLAYGLKEMEQCYRARNSKAEFLSENCILTYGMTLLGDSTSNPGVWLKKAKSGKGTEADVEGGSHV